ncbi:MAG: sensor domain-containing diguanylate cyclase/phosphohydrolase [Bacillota bacterium]
MAEEKQEEIIYRNKLLEALFKNSTDAIVYFDQNYRIIDINNNFQKLFGYSLSEVNGKDVDDVIEQGKEKSANRDYTEKVLTGETIIAEGTRYTKDGNPLEVLIKGIPVVINNKFCGGYAIYADITKQKLAEQALKESEEKYKGILGSIKDGYFEVDLKGKINFCNEAAARMLGYSIEEFIGTDYRDICKNHKYVFNTFNRLFQTGKTKHILATNMIQKDGSEVYGELTLSVIQDRYGNILGFRGLGRDVTERKLYEDQLKFLSLHDQLTGLYNRSYFENELQRLSNSREYPITIIVTDLDGLKLINDTVGHEKGDQMLKICAEILANSLRSSDILARVGGDELVIVLPRTNYNSGEKLVSRIQAKIEAYNCMQPEQIPLSISIGLATSENKDKSLQKTFKEADDLMYRDKLNKGVIARSQIIKTLMDKLEKIEYVDKGHTRRLQELCLKVGKVILLPGEQLSALNLLAQVHNLGKVGIPDDIIFKNGHLTEDEWTIIKQHPEKGCRIALASSNLSGIADLILKHHEHWDGSGYPLGIGGDEIPIECRILSIVDAYDSMTNNRPYRKAMSRHEAKTELKKFAGSKFDPELVQVFLSVLEQSG